MNGKMPEVLPTCCAAKTAAETIGMGRCRSRSKTLGNITVANNQSAV